MRSHLNASTVLPALALRCECGTRVRAEGRRRLVELTRMHIGEFHPDLGSDLRAELIVAMAEEGADGPGPVA